MTSFRAIKYKMNLALLALICSGVVCLLATVHAFPMFAPDEKDEWPIPNKEIFDKSFDRQKRATQVSNQQFMLNYFYFINI
jgi:hypothetical protein